MRILVYPHDLAIGGSQINAIDLAAGAQAAGHDVVVYGIPGPLTDYIAEKRLRFIPASPTKYRPAPSRIIELMQIAKRERIDLIHAYEWPPCLDAYYGASLIMGVRLLCTVLSMSVSPEIPRHVPLIMGTDDLGREAKARQAGPVWVLEPPIDIARDTASSGASFRNTHSIADDSLLVASVSRLALDLKLDALVRAIDAVEILGHQLNLTLALVGDGPARAALDERAAGVNRRLGRRAVILCGQTLDPRSAYAAADLVIGMGSSALRALAVGRAVIVQGERAFSEVFEPATLDLFLRQGFYGLGDDATGVERLAEQMKRLLLDRGLRDELGQYGRQLISERFSLARAVELQLDIYRQVMDTRVIRSFKDPLSSALCALAIEIGNHNPFVRRRRQVRTQALLAAASAGIWPPELHV